MEILYKKEKEEADQLLEQQRLVSTYAEIILLRMFCATIIKDVISAVWVC